MAQLNWKAVHKGGLYICELASRVFNASVFSSGKHEPTINEVLLYGGEEEHNTKLSGLDNLLCIYYMIMHTSRSVNICLPSLVSNTLANCLVNSRQRNNIKIRVAIHKTEEFQHLEKFVAQGIEVKEINSTVPMDHEFLLIDAGEDDAVAVLGPIDYETAQAHCSRAATLLTSEAAVVRTLNIEFERVWNTTQ